MKRKPLKCKVLQLFGENSKPGGASEASVNEIDAGRGEPPAELQDGQLPEDISMAESMPNGENGFLDDLPDPSEWILGTLSSSDYSGQPTNSSSTLDASDTLSDGSASDSVIHETASASMSGIDDGGKLEHGRRVLRLFGPTAGRGSQKNIEQAVDTVEQTAAYWHVQKNGDAPPDLSDLLELLAGPDFSSHSSAVDQTEGPILSFPTLDRILGRLATAVSRRLYALTTRRWVVSPNTAKRVLFTAWSRFTNPVASTFNLFPLEGAALMGADGDLVRLLTARLFDRGPERRFTEDHRLDTGELQSVSSQAVAAHCLHVFQLDLEWALAPFFEVETTRGRVILSDEPIIEFGEEEECVLSTFLVSDGEHGGKFMLLFPADMLRPLEMLLASNSKVLMPASTETDDEVFLRLRTLSDEALTAMLEQSHPLLASVVLYRMSEDRRLRILQGMPTDVQEELVRRMGRRASVLRTLSLEQRVAVRSLLMGEGYTSHILRMCTPEAAARFLGTVATLPSLFPSQAAEICGEENPAVTCGSPLVVDKGTVTRLLMRSFSSDTFVLVSKLLAEGTHALPFDSIALCNPEHITALLMHESYGVGGLVLRHLLRKAPDVAAAAFAMMDSMAQPAILERVIMPRSVDVDIVHTVENALCEHIPLACKAVEPSTDNDQKARCSSKVCFSDAQILMSGMDRQARINLVHLMERSGIPMPSDSLIS